MQGFSKNWLLVWKVTWAIWTISDKQWEVQKVEIWWATFVQKIHLSKKHIPSAKTLYTEDLSNTIFNYLCENSPNYRCHFWNHKLFFTKQILCIFSAQILHTSHKTSPTKCKILDFPLLGLKFSIFLMSFFKQKLLFLQSLDLFWCHER